MHDTNLHFESNDIKKEIFLSYKILILKQSLDFVTFSKIINQCHTNIFWTVEMKLYFYTRKAFDLYNDFSIHLCDWLRLPAG